MATRFMVEAGGYVAGGIDERIVMGKKGDVCGRKDDCCSDESSSSSSSIGENSDDFSGNTGEKSGDDEVQSSYKGPLDAMESLEQVLPIRRGISSFYNGKSKSFASLADASSKDLAKPDNAYVRRRRNMLACNLNWDRTTSSSSSLRGNGNGNGNGGGISKRVSFRSGRTTLALAVAMSNYDKQQCDSSNVCPARKDSFPCRSFSLADLQPCSNSDAKPA